MDTDPNGSQGLRKAPGGDRRPDVMPLSALTLASVSTASRAAWQSLYDADATAMPSQSPPWADMLVATGHFADASRQYEFSDGIRAVLPLFESRAPVPSLTRAWSPPVGWGYAGVLSSTPIAAEHACLILADLQSSGRFATHVRPNPLQSRAWSEAAGAAWRKADRLVHVLDLDGGFPVVWSQRFRPRTRTTINKAERSGLTVESGNSDRLLDEFYALLEKSFARWGHDKNQPEWFALWRGRQRDPIARFRAMAAALGPMLRIWVARRGSDPVAAVLVLQDRNAHYTRGAMDAALVEHTGAPYLLHSWRSRRPAPPAAGNTTWAKPAGTPRSPSSRPDSVRSRRRTSNCSTSACLCRVRATGSRPRSGGRLASGTPETGKNRPQLPNGKLRKAWRFAICRAR